MTSSAQAKPKIKARQRPPSVTVIGFSLMLLATLGGLALVAVSLSDPAALPIRKIMVEGNFNHLTTERIEARVVEAVNVGFFRLDVDEIREMLLDEPWIFDATIRRVWPGTLRVSIVEQNPVAYWGSNALLNQFADIFVPLEQEIPLGLVRLNGPVGSESEVLERYQFISGLLAENRLRPAAVHLSERHAWTVTLNDGHRIVIGRREFEHRLRRFAFAYEQGLKAFWHRIGSVDLRYTNGFAVGAAAAEEVRG